jgi:riboflavin kinase / FMN adenylyltransferase
MGDFYKGISEVKSSSGRAITVGNFDGIHLGHLAIIQGLCDEADKRGLEPLIITFNPHPREVINPDEAPKLIFLPDEEGHALQNVYSGDVLSMPFTEKIRNLTALEFISDVLIKRLSMKALISGENNTIGKDRCGDQQRLAHLAQELDYDFIVIPKVIVDGRKLSSSAIRESIAAGDMQAANSALTQPYSISGEVIRGMGLGRKLGYPTANLHYQERKSLPKEGVYAAEVIVRGVCYGGMMFIGKNYLNPEDAFSVEANILDFDEDIYGEVITFRPLAFVRANRRMSGKEELVKQIDKDKIVIREILEQKETERVCKK